MSHHATFLIVTATSHLLVGLLAAAAYGADFVVNSTADVVDLNEGDGVCFTADEECTLRAAIMEANALFGRDYIEVPAGTYVLSIAGHDDDAALTGDLDITEDLTIFGASMEHTVVDANGIDRVFHVIGAIDVALEELAARNGNSGNDIAGGIWVDGATLALTDCRINDNWSPTHAGGIYVADGTLIGQGTAIQDNVAAGGDGGGVVALVSLLELSDCWISGNSAALTGGGLSIGSVLGATLTGCAIVGNSAMEAGGGLRAGGLGTLSVHGTLVASNTTTGDGGGMHLDGPGSLANCTFSGNQAWGNGAGIYAGCVATSAGLELNNVTITGNTVDNEVDDVDGGGIFVVDAADCQSGEEPVTVSVANTIIAGNLDEHQTGTIQPDCSGLFVSEGYNLIGDNRGCESSFPEGLPNENDDWVGTGSAPLDPGLTPLQDNLGPTLTHALWFDSLAIDHGNPGGEGTMCELLDQREMSRPNDGDGDLIPVCDIGAVEYRDCNGNAIDDGTEMAAEGTGFQDPAAWAAYTPVVQYDGFNGGVFDGRYVYFAPLSGNVLRYDTMQEFADPSSWAEHDVTAPPTSAVGAYEGAIFDGRYVYFVPWGGPGGHGEVLRYDTWDPFHDFLSWSTFDVVSGIEARGGYVGGVFDGRYVYYAPHQDGSDAGGWHGEVLRYDTLGPFTGAESWLTFDAISMLGARGGYTGAAFDGQYVYFAPYADDNSVHGAVLRYDTNGAFELPDAWEVYDPGDHGVGDDPDGYWGAAFDGVHVYFVPFLRSGGAHGEVLRYAAGSSFTDTLSWTTFDYSASGECASDPECTDPVGYMGAAFDGRYLYCAPFCNGTEEQHGEVLRHDTAGAFDGAPSWVTYDPGNNGIGYDPDGYDGAVFDGRYIYFVPYHNGTAYHSEVLRYDTFVGWSRDCNDNNIPDECDIADGTSYDCNDNDIPDECDVAGGPSADCNENGVPDECDVVPPSPFGENLLENPGAEAGDITGWTPAGWVLPGVRTGDPDPYEGEYYFFAGDVSGSVSIEQTLELLDMGFSAGDLDCGAIAVHVGGYQRSWDAYPYSIDTGQIAVEYLDADMGVLDTFVGPVKSNTQEWELVDDWRWLPVGTRSIRYVFTSTRASGDNNDGFLDSAFVVLTSHPNIWDCNANGVPDECDVASGYSEDCNANGVPDECDVANDVPLDANLLANPGAETGDTTGWTDDPTGSFFAITGIPPVEPGSAYVFYPDSQPVASLEQTVDLLAQGFSAFTLDTERFLCRAGGWLRNGQSSDNGQISFMLLDEAGVELARFDSPIVNSLNNWTQVEKVLPLPSTTRLVRFRYTAYRGAGTSNDAYLDSAYVILSGLPPTSTDCNDDGVPDECEPDCNFNGIPDPCELGVGSALRFDGGDLVRVATPVGLPLGNDPRTVELWVYRDDPGNEQGIFTYGTEANGQMFGLVLTGNCPGSPSRVGFFGYNADLCFNTPLPVDAWTHLAVTYDAATVRLYLNGSLDNFADRALNTVLSGAGLHIGSRINNVRWWGDLDEVRIWDHARTEGQIQANMYRHLTGGEAGLAGYWAFEELDGQDVFDLSPLGNHGTLGWDIDPSTDDPGRVASSVSLVPMDCDYSGVPDECEIADGTLADCNDNLLPDVCEPIAGIDYDLDGDMDLADYAGFAECLGGPGVPPSPLFPECTQACLDAFDADFDMDVDLNDFAAFEVGFADMSP
jgi:CSLREA domain-containing protein